MTALEIISVLLLVCGGLFFFAGTIGLLRFRDVHSRLHALSKADNLGLGLVSVGLMLNAESVASSLKILVIWLLALFASGVTCFVVAEWEMSHGRRDQDQ